VAGARLTMDAAARSEHRFATALTASVALHAAAMMISLPASRLAPFPAPAPLQVRLFESPLVAPEPTNPAAEQSARARRVPQKQETATAGTAPSPAPPVTALVRARALRGVPPRRAPAPPVTAHALEALPEAPAPVPAPSVLSPGVPSSEPARPPGAAYAAVAPAPELLSGYGKMISQALARYKEYPQIAQMRGWEGSVTMRLRVAPSGQLIDAELHTSSGHDVLDKQALAMAGRARRLPVPPEGLSRGEIAVLVPIVFRLER
jgi:protein TonB